MKSFKEFLMEGPPSPFLTKDRNVQSVKKAIAGKQAKAKGPQTVRDMYKALLPELKQIKKKFETVVKKGLPKGDKQKIRFFSQIKPEDSLVNKIVVRGNAPDTIGDIVRGALLFPDQKAVEVFVKDFRRKNSNLVAGYEMKAKGTDKELGYYGSHHLDLMINGLMVELQVMTRKMWKFKESAHVLYTNNRDKISKGGHASRRDSALSKQIYALANQPRFQKNDFDDWTETEFNFVLGEDFDAFEEVILD